MIQRRVNPIANNICDMTWKEAEVAGKKAKFIVISTGSVEQHGPHLPLGADFMVASRVASELSQEFPSIHVPLSPFGTNFAFKNWPGTISISAKTYSRMLVEVMLSAAEICPRIIVVNGHDENQETLIAAAREVVQSGKAKVACFEWAKMVRDVLRTVCESRNEMHGGEGLTSLFMHWFPDHVRDDLIDIGYIRIAKMVADDVHRDPHAFLPKILNPGDPGDSGVFGDPRLANAEKGSRIAAALKKRSRDLVTELQWDNE